MRQEKVQSFFSQTSSSVIFIFSVARRLMNVFYVFNLSSALAIVVYSVILAYSAFGYIPLLLDFLNLNEAIQR